MGLPDPRVGQGEEWAAFAPTPGYDHLAFDRPQLQMVAVADATRPPLGGHALADRRGGGCDFCPKWSEHQPQCRRASSEDTCCWVCWWRAVPSSAPPAAAIPGTSQAPRPSHLGPPSLRPPRQHFLRSHM